MKKLLQIAFILFPIYAYAGDVDPDSEFGKLVNNASHDFVTCASFYTLLAQALRNSDFSDAPELAIKQDEYREVALYYALTLAELTRTEKMAMKVTAARYEHELDSMQKEIEGNLSNMSILMIKHLESCKEKMENPAAFSKEWQDKILKELGIDQ